MLLVTAQENQLRSTPLASDARSQARTSASTANGVGAFFFLSSCVANSRAVRPRSGICRYPTNRNGAFRRRQVARSCADLARFLPCLGHLGLLVGILCGKQATAGEISKVILQYHLAVMQVTD